MLEIALSKTVDGACDLMIQNKIHSGSSSSQVKYRLVAFIHGIYKTS